MMFRGKIAAVSYLNTIPMIYGIEHTDDLCASLLLSPPSRCAKAFAEGEADIALVPVGALPDLDDFRIITSYCIGASDAVRTVTIMSNSPIEQCRVLWLDSHSRSSALLAKILCDRRWGVTPEYRQLDQYEVVDEAGANEAFLLIGDKVFDYEGRFAYSYDLALEWQTMTSLPMVFAVWVARNSVPQEVVDRLNDAIGYGVSHVREAIDYYGHSGKPYAYDYLTKNIDFLFDELKHKALELYWQEGTRFYERINPG